MQQKYRQANIAWGTESSQGCCPGCPLGAGGPLAALDSCQGSPEGLEQIWLIYVCSKAPQLQQGGTGRGEETAQSYLAD